MYTTKIIEKSIQRSAKRITVKVEFTKDNISHTDEFSFSFAGFSLDVLKRAINDYVSTLEKAENDVALLPDGDIDTTVVEKQPVPPTQAEIDKEKWLKQYNILQELKPLIDNGILAGTEPKIVALKTALKNNFKAEYLNL